MKEIPIGISDFKTLRKNDYFYVDKSLFIKDIAKNVGKTLLFTRPRRFGKTLNMSMLSYFFNIKNADNNKKLFLGLDIEKNEFWKEHGQYPVIFASFKDINATSIDESINEVYKIVFNILAKEKYIYEKLSIENKMIFDDLLKNRDSIFLNNAFKYLSQFLYEYYNKNVIILIDEYDKPIISAHANNYYDKAIKFFKSLYGSALKDNEYLQFAVMTGIMRVAKEGIFSGLNNLMVDTILDKNYEDYFGLSENDVDIALKEYKLKDNIDEVKEWYNGYLFGGKEVYNPWSILNYLYKRELAAYWINTSDNFLIKQALDVSDDSTYKALESLFNGDKIEKLININFAFGESDFRKHLWTLLLFSGYVTIAGDKNEYGEYSLKIPNKEIYSFFREAFIEKFTMDAPEHFTNLVKTLSNGNIIGTDSFEYNLKKIFLSNTSYYNTANETFYHGAMIILSLIFEKNYIIHSDIESGYGRADLILEPRNIGKTGYIFEFKVSDSDENLEKKLDDAIKQIEDKKYETLLSKKGIKHILGIAIAFHGKDLKVKCKEL
jgi:hypothetical protein